MQSVSLTCHTDRTELVLKGSLDVSGARAAYETLTEALQRALPLTLEAAELERIDAAGMQLLLNFTRTAGERGLGLQWQSVGSVLETSAETLGLTAVLELPK